MAPEINLVDPDTYRRGGAPHDQFAWLREHAPVFWHEEPNGPGFWAVTRYQGVYDVDRNFQAFSSLDRAEQICHTVT